MARPRITPCFTQIELARGALVAVLLATLIWLGGGRDASAATCPSPGVLSGEGTCTFTYTAAGASGETTLSVPAGVTMTVTAYGGPGGYGENNLSQLEGSPGGGGMEQGTFKVSASELLTILVGEEGSQASAAGEGGGGFGDSDYNGGSLEQGGKGGGGSYVFGPSGAPLLVAGGGGGAGTDNGATFEHGGAGGDAAGGEAGEGGGTSAVECGGAGAGGAGGTTGGPGEGGAAALCGKETVPSGGNGKGPVTGPQDPNIVGGNSGLDTIGGWGGSGGIPGTGNKYGMAGGGGGGYTGGGGGGDSQYGGGGAGGGGAGYVSSEAATSSGEKGVWFSNVGKVTISYEQKPISGAITDAKGQPIEAATVTLKGTETEGGSVDLSTKTAADGSYSFEVNPGSYDLDATTETPPGQAKGGKWFTLECPEAAAKGGTCHVNLKSGETAPVTFQYVLPDIQAEAVEITQGIQDEGFDTPTSIQVPGLGTVIGGSYTGVPEVKDVPTVVRVFASVAGAQTAEAQKNVEVELHAYSSGTGGLTELAGSPISAPPRTLNVGDSLPSARTDPAGAYSFTLPQSWTEQGPITLVAELNPEHGGERPIPECGKCEGNDGYALTQVNFTSTEKITIRPFRIVYRYPLPGGGFKTMSGPDLSNEFDRAKDILPLAPGNLSVDAFPQAELDISAAVKRVVDYYRLHHVALSQPNLSDCVERPGCRESIQNFEFDAVRRQLALAHAGKTYLFGFEPIPDGVTWTKQGVSIIGPDNPPRPLTSTTHELLHLVGFEHASPACGGGAEGQIGERWPPDERGYIHGIGLERVPNSGGPGLFKIIAPGVGEPQWYDFMSYCANVNDKDAWISTNNWTKFVHLDEVATGQASPPAKAPAVAISAGAASSSLHAASAQTGPRMTIDAGVTLGGEVTLLGASETTESLTPSQPSAYQVRVLGSSGHVIADVGAPAEALADGGGSQMISANVPARGASTIEIIKGSKVVAVEHRPKPGPRVRLIVPRGGLKPSHAKLPIRWTDSGARDAPLTASVQYLSSTQHGWQTLAAGLTGRSFRAPVSLFSPADRVRIRVVVGDGFSDAIATTKTLRLSHN
jgi:Carboxypeptidase regulatory-like domain